jgi:[ribosomal protein S18]-alanine N-acetyltransferase
MSVRALLRSLRSPRAAVWVAEEAGGGRVLGSLILSTRPDIGFARIFTLMVDPAARGQGLGRRLVRAAEREARRRGCFTLSLEVREDNQAARGLYQTLGYREHTRLHGYYHDGCDGIRLRRRLDRPARGVARGK